MQRLSHLLIGYGFIWFATWSMLGSLLGAKIALTMASSETSWMVSWNRELLRSAHAHMNSMAIILVLTGLCVRYLVRFGAALQKTGWAMALSVPIFGLGMCLEAFNPPTAGHVPWIFAVTALGGGGFILATTSMGVMFLASALRCQSPSK